MKPHLVTQTSFIWVIDTTELLETINDADFVFLALSRSWACYSSVLVLFSTLDLLDLIFALICTTSCKTQFIQVWVIKIRSNPSNAKQMDWWKYRTIWKTAEEERNGAHLNELHDWDSRAWIICEMFWNSGFVPTDFYMRCWILSIPTVKWMTLKCNCYCLVYLLIWKLWLKHFFPPVTQTEVTEW